VDNIGLVQGATLSMFRTARGLAQADLAERAGMAQSRLSRIEQGVEALAVADAAKIADALDVVADALAADGGEFGSARVFHRKRASLPIKADRRIRAEAAVRRFQLRRALGEALLPLQVAYRPLPADGTYNAEDRAIELRRALDLGSGPIPNMTAVLERAGAIVVPANLDTVKLDAIAGWPVEGAPIVMMSVHAPGDRQRFTLAHELGHAVLHDGTGDDQEREADEFASAFLLPAAAVREELRTATLSSFAALKPRWGVSIAALGRRARDLGLMPDREYRAFNIQLSTSGMHRQEPAPIAPEQPTLVRSTIAQLIRRGDTLDAIAARAGMPTASFIRTYVEDQ
jgi:Zn-dependent peptidase ImmA (M78 family)/DNA-binding Xre family transcriptional regulator